MKKIENPTQVILHQPIKIDLKHTPDIDHPRERDILYSIGNDKRTCLLALVRTEDSLNGQIAETVYLANDPIHDIDEIRSIACTVNPGDCHITWFKGIRANLDSKPNLIPSA